MKHLWRLITTPYEPDGAFTGFLDRAASQENDRAAVTVAVLTAAESRKLFGVDLARRGIQPVFLQFVTIDPRYFTPLEAAAATHFSIMRRLSAFGAMAWLFVPLFALVPLKLVTAWLGNGRMDDFFRDRGFRLRPIAPGETAEGFVFTTLDLGTKAVHVRLTSVGGIAESLAGAEALPAGGEAAHTQAVSDFTFTVPVPGIAVDYHDQDFARLRPAAAVEDCTIDGLVTKLEALPAATTNAAGTRPGDP
ncbi:MAG: hypothetical protein EBS56_13585, partial [Planctomycetia bacterium]|nr:hypothetical protein [Planctomycetia bacterium]